MGTKTVVETVYGKFNKFEVVKDSGGVFSSPTFYIYKDGAPYKGSYNSLADAVDAARREK